VRALLSGFLNGRALTDVTFPLLGRLFFETNCSPIGILLAFGTACVLLAGTPRRTPKSTLATVPPLSSE